MDVCRDTPHADTHEMILRAGDTNTATSTPVRRERPSDDCGGGADHRAAGPGRAHRAHRPGVSGLPRAPVPPVLMSAEEKRKASWNLRKVAPRKRKTDRQGDSRRALAAAPSEVGGECGAAREKEAKGGWVMAMVMALLGGRCGGALPQHIYK